MRISRVVIRNYRAIECLDINVDNELCCLIGENNAGKTAIIRAIQLCIDVALPSYFRSLSREDINASVDVSSPSQVLIGLELTDFEGKENEEALVATWKTGVDAARIFYRFRPKPSIREQLDNDEIEEGNLALDDYSWEIKGGGDPAIDLLDIEWNDDGIGESIRFSDLQSFLVTHLPALRDVETDLRNFRLSPLIKLIEAFDIDSAEQQALVAILDDANDQISQSQTIAQVADAIDERFKEVSGPAFEMDAGVGLSASTFRAILQNLKIILSDLSLQDFEPGRNGLGMNNILYIAILLEYLKRRVEGGNSSGQLVLIEEPEAHLHPQLQASLMTALIDTGVQVILTSHSTHVTSHVSLATVVSLTKRSNATISVGNLASNSDLDDNEVADLERYLDSTKSSLLFARKVMLVEGPSELFLIPDLFQSVEGVDLERAGISVVAIHGVHFDVYAKLFQAGSLEKKCAIVADADLTPSDASDEFSIVDDAPILAALEGDFVKVFVGATTFERELVSEATLPMFIEAVRDLGAPQVLQALETGLAELELGLLSDEEEEALLNELRTRVLNTAKRFGKSRFAQVAARHADEATGIPEYIMNAYQWLTE